jgi:hypothetical protein
MEPTSGTENRAFSEELEQWLKSDGPKTVGSLQEVFDEKSFAVAIVVLMFPSSTPLPTGGVTHVLEAMTVLLALQMILGRHTIWLPKRLLHRELGDAMTGKAIPFLVRRIRWFEKHSHPRWARLFEQSWFLRVLGLLIAGFTISAAVAPPFSGLDTLPSLGVLIICLAILLEDVVFLAVGCFIGTGGVLLIIFLGRAAVHFVKGLF